MSLSALPERSLFARTIPSRSVAAGRTTPSTAGSFRLTGSMLRWSSIQTAWPITWRIIRTITGIGPVKAKLIADAFGHKFDRSDPPNPEAVAAVAKIPIAAIQNLQRIWIETSEVNAAMTYLASYGLTHFQITTLVGNFGNHVVPMLQEDPYILISEVPGFGFKRVDKIARRLGTPKELPSRLQAGIRYAIQSALDDGDCWVEYEDLLDRANALLVLDNLDSRELIERQLEGLVGAKDLVCCPYERLVVADPAIHEMEEFLAGVFRTAWARNPNGTGAIPGHAYFNEPLNADQRTPRGRHSSFPSR